MLVKDEFSTTRTCPSADAWIRDKCSKCLPLRTADKSADPRYICASFHRRADMPYEFVKPVADHAPQKFLVLELYSPWCARRGVFGCEVSQE